MNMNKNLSKNACKNMSKKQIQSMARLIALSAWFALPWMASSTAHAAGQVTIKGLFDGARKALAGPAAESPVVGSTAAPAPANAAVQDEEQAAFQRALQAYTVTVKDLAAKNDLPVHQWNQTYLRTRTDVQAYTETSIDGMYALRNVRPTEENEALVWAKSGGILFEYQPIVIFPASGSGFLARKDNSSPGPQAWIVYDKAKGYLSGENARPYIQAMLTTMDTRPLPGVGEGRRTFILYTSPSCPYSGKIQPALEKSGMSFRIFPTYTINPGEDYAGVHQIFCASNKTVAFKEALAERGRRQAEFKRTGKMKPLVKPDNWFCRRDIMPNVLLRDIDFIFGQGYPTPSFYFADGTVIAGADKLDAVRAKSKEMEAKGLYFK
jgi:hypothetical protein